MDGLDKKVNKFILFSIIFMIWTPLWQIKLYKIFGISTHLAFIINMIGIYIPGGYLCFK